jgi:hypothetical protein
MDNATTSPRDRAGRHAERARDLLAASSDGQSAQRDATRADASATLAVYEQLRDLTDVIRAGQR